MQHMTLNDWLEFFDFGYEYTNEPNSEGDVGYSFIDFQNVYLGDIDDERYDDPLGMVDRIVDSIYWDDYIVEDLEYHGYVGNYTLEDMYQFTLDHPEIYGNNGLYVLYYAMHPERLVIDVKPTT